MAERPHRVVIRTTQKHFDQVNELARNCSSDLSKTLRKLIRSGLEIWRRGTVEDVPYHGLGMNGTAYTGFFQLRMPDDLFQELEDIIDDMEYTRTDLYLRMIELGRENENAT